MSKSRFFLLLIISIVLFSLSGCELFSGNLLQIRIEPYSELYNEQLVDIFINNSRRTASRFDDGEQVRIRVRSNIPNGIEFKYWELPGGNRVTREEHTVIMNERKIVTAIFEVDDGVAVLGSDGRPIYNKLLHPQEAFKEGQNRDLVFMPGDYIYDLDVLGLLGNIRSLRGSNETRIFGTIFVLNSSSPSFEGFTFIPNLGEPALLFPISVGRDVTIRDNYFPQGNGILFENKIAGDLGMINNSFKGEKGVTFDGIVESDLYIVNNNFETDYGLDFLKNIDGKVLIDRNNFKNGLEAIYFPGDILKELTIDRNSFSQIETGINFRGNLQTKINITRNSFNEIHTGIYFGEQVVYHQNNEILIHQNRIEKASFSGIEFNDYQNTHSPRLRITENTFLDCYNNDENAIALYFFKYDLISGFNQTGDRDPFIRRNNFQGNDFALGTGDYIFLELNYDHIIDARYNWWGHSNGPSLDRSYPRDRGDYVHSAHEKIVVFPWANNPY